MLLARAACAGLALLALACHNSQGDQQERHAVGLGPKTVCFEVEAGLRRLTLPDAMFDVLAVDSTVPPSLNPAQREDLEVLAPGARRGGVVAVIGVEDPALEEFVAAVVVTETRITDASGNVVQSHGSFAEDPGRIDVIVEQLRMSGELDVAVRSRLPPVIVSLTPSVPGKGGQELDIGSVLAFVDDSPTSISFAYSGSVETVEWASRLVLELVRSIEEVSTCA